MLQVENQNQSQTDLVTNIFNKKLSYRKQIARKLRTQYVEGI